MIDRWIGEGTSMIKADTAVVVEKPSKTELVGKSVKRKEDYEVLVGRERYTADYKLPHMLYTAIYRSPYAHARIIGLDLSKALKQPGVVLGLGGKDIPEYAKPMPPFPFQSKNPFRQGNPTIKFYDHHCLATDKVRFVGEAVAVIVATDRYLAEDAMEYITAEFEPCPLVVDAEAAPGKYGAFALPGMGGQPDAQVQSIRRRCGGGLPASRSSRQGKNCELEIHGHADGAACDNCRLRPKDPSAYRVGLHTDSSRAQHPHTRNSQFPKYKGEGDCAAGWGWLWSEMGLLS